MNFPCTGCKVLLSLSVCSVSFSTAFYICDLLYSVLSLSFGKQDQLPTPTWQWVTLAPIFGSFILYLLVNKIRVFCALVNETAYSCGRFSNFVVWILAYYYILRKVFWRLAFLHRLWSYYSLSFLLSISYYTGIHNWSVPHVVGSCHLLQKNRVLLQGFFGLGLGFKP
jgi:hypothetical protein